MPARALLRLPLRQEVRVALHLPFRLRLRLPPPTRSHSQPVTPTPGPRPRPRLPPHDPLSPPEPGSGCSGGSSFGRSSQPPRRCRLELRTAAAAAATAAGAGSDDSAARRPPPSPEAAAVAALASAAAAAAAAAAADSSRGTTGCLHSSAASASEAAAPQPAAAAMSGGTAESARAPAPPSSISVSQDLDLDPAQLHLPPSSNLDGSLAARKEAQVMSVTQSGAMAAFPVVLSEGQGGGFHWVVGETPGRRRSMEDAHVVNLDIDGSGTALFAVFDGHSGREVSAFCAQHIVEEVVGCPDYSRGELRGALQGAFLALDRRMRAEDSRGELAGYAAGDTSAAKYGIMDPQGRYQGPQAGSTAAVALVRGDQLVVAHAGDSRVVLSAGGVALALTEDHKPDLPGERDRIQRAGEFVLERPGRVPRVRGSLAMSRAIGDVRFKNPQLPPNQQAVTAAPDTAAVRLAPPPGAGAGVDVLGEPGAELMPELYPAGAEGAAGAEGPAAGSALPPHPPLLVVACDGLWDVMNRQMVINFLELQLARNGGHLRAAVSALMHEALRHDSATQPTADNVTAVVVLLPTPRPEK